MIERSKQKMTNNERVELIRTSIGKISNMSKMRKDELDKLIQLIVA